MPGLPQVTLQLLCYPTGKLAHAPLGTYAYHTTHTYVAVSPYNAYVCMKADWCWINKKGFNCTYVIVILYTYDYMNFLQVQVNLLPVPKQSSWLAIVDRNDLF